MHLDLPLAPIIRSSAVVPRDVARDVQRRARPPAQGDAELRRLVRGAYTTTEAWRALTPRERHVLLVTAVLPHLPGAATVSHLSAAALMDWPHIGRWPDRVIAHDPSRRRVVRLPEMELHPTPVELPTLVGTGTHTSIRMTTPPLTAAELARTLPFDQAVVALDHALREGWSRPDVSGWIDALGHRTARRAHVALDFASPLAGSPGESWARAVLRQIGAVSPQLQHRFDGPRGQVAYVDFWFSTDGVVVEFDGEAKYRDPAFLHGRSPEQAVIDEKYREDWIRALPGVRGFVRLSWADLHQPRLVAAKLRAAGLTLST